MHVLHHFPLCPFSRKVRVVLWEKGIRFNLIYHKFWERNREFAALNPAMQVPVLVEPNKYKIADSNVICEYIDEVYKNDTLIGKTPKQRAETRRITSWFDDKFYNEVTKYLLKEKAIRFITREGTPNSDAIRAANSNIQTHMKYIEFLLSDKRWLTGETLTLADVSAAAQISVADYLNSINWEKYPEAREWYALIKSRPSFRQILQDRIPGIKPPSFYDDPDF